MKRMTRYDERPLEMLGQIIGLTTVKELEARIEEGNTIKVYKRG